MRLPVYHPHLLFARSWTGRLFIILSLLVLSLALPARPAQAVPLLSPITVTTTADEYGSGAGCSLREAITAANNDAAFGGCPAGSGADTITLPAATYTLTQPNLGGVNEDGNATGDLDINTSLTIQGAGAVATIIQAGTNAANGIDKVLGVNPYCITSINVAISGVTIRYGRNTQSFGRDDFSYTGGGLDWCGAGAGSFTLSNSIVSDNTNVTGYGGGLNVDLISGYTGAVNLTNVTFQNNKTTSTASQAMGGGLNIFGSQPNVTISGCQILNNSTAHPGSEGQGGGMNIRLSNGGSVQVHNSTISGNTAGNIGGGINIITFHSTTVINIDQDTRITNNISGGAAGGTSGGGGIAITSGTMTATPIKLSKITVSGNAESALATNRLGGGGIYAYWNNVTVEYSRIVNNTILSTTGGSGLLASGSGTVTAANNWWGCSSGPGAAPCDTAVLESGSTGSLISTPYLRLSTTAAASPLVTNQSTLVTTSFGANSAGTDVSANIDRLIGLPVTWSAGLGNLSGQQNAIQSGGTATASYQATSAGAGQVAAVVDKDTPTSGRPNVAAIPINKAAATVTILSDAPDASDPGQAVTVQYTLAGAQGNSPTAPTGTVSVGDGVDTQTCALPATTCAVTLTTPGSRTITASYSGDLNFNTGADTEAHTVTLIAPDLSVTKSDASDPVTAGENITYTLNLTNTGTAAAQSTTLTDAVPANTTFVSAQVTSGTGWSVAAPAVGATGSVVFSKSTMAVAETAAFQVVVMVNRSAANGATITNTATAASTSTDSDPADNTASATTTVQARADLAVTMSGTPDPVTAGGNIAYTIHVSSSGPSDAQAVSLTNAVPANTTFVSAQVTGGSGWSVSAPAVGGTGNVVFSKGTFAAAETAAFQVIVKVNGNAGGGATISAAATAASATTDPSGANNTASAATTVQALVITIGAGSAPSETGPANGGFNITLSAAPTTNLAVSYALAGSTAARPADYSLAAGTNIVAVSDTTFTLAAGATSASLNIVPIDDAIAEGDETVNLALTAGSGYQVGAQGSAAQTITDNDILYNLAGPVGFSEGSGGSTSITFIITRYGDTARASSVDFSLGGTATGGVDYTNVIPAPGKISFDASVIQRSITLDVVGDFIDEDNETIIVILSNATGTGGGGTGLTSGSPYTATIPDDDQAGVEIGPTSLTVAEPNGSEQFTISLTSQPAAAVTFNISSSDPGECSVPASVVIQPGAWQSAASVTVSAVNDGIQDGTQSCLVQLLPAASADPLYQGVDPQDVEVTVLDMYAVYLPFIGR